jgi:hypothetical protein
MEKVSEMQWDHVQRTSSLGAAVAKDATETKASRASRNRAATEGKGMMSERGKGT